MRWISLVSSEHSIQMQKYTPSSQVLISTQSIKWIFMCICAQLYLAEGIQNVDPYICCLQETHFRLQDTYRMKVRGWTNIFHTNAKECTFFSSTQGALSRRDHILGHKSNLNKFKKVKIIASIFSDHNTMSSVQFSRSVMSDSLRPHVPQHARLPCPSPTPRVHPNPCPLCR